MNGPEDDLSGSVLEWMLIARHIEKPWPVAAAWLDLDAIDQFVTFTHGALFPGRVKLARRWGWSEARAAKILRHYHDTDCGLDSFRRRGEEHRVARDDLFGLVGQ